MKELVFFLEEASARAMLQQIVPRLIPLQSGVNTRYIVFEGKQNLDKQLSHRLSGYLNKESRFIVVRDQDQADCGAVKKTLTKLCAAAGRPDTKVRIACRELEAFYLGDLLAVETGLAIKGLAKLQAKAKFRDADLLPSPARELVRLTNSQYQKVAGSRAIAPFLNLEEPRSRSFRQLIDSIRTAVQALSSPTSLLPLVLLPFLLCGLRGQPIPASPPDLFSGNPRLIVISDIGNEPDDQMSLTRLLLYSNQIDIEALIASTSTWQKAAAHPETMRALIEAYGKVRAILMLHAKGWPAAELLQTRVFTGQTAYGMAATGADRMSEGAQAIVQAADREDGRPLWIAAWGGVNTLAQALLRVRATRTPTETDRFVNKLRVYSISDQDDAGPWIRREFPNLFYIVQPSTPTGGEYGYATWTGISGDAYYRNGAGADFTTVTNEWLEANIRSKGPLGKLYPRFLFIMEGDTPSFLSLIGNGLNAYARPDWGGWGGRYVYRQPYGETHAIWTQGGDLFSRVTSQDTVTGLDGRAYISDQATIWRWRDAFQNDFAARMSWTVSDYAHANHPPVAIVNGHAGSAPIFIDLQIGKSFLLDASESRDPDGQTLHYHWFHYPEAGGADTNLAGVTISDADQPQATVSAHSVCRPAWLPGVVPCNGNGVAHIILAVTDNGSPALTTYRRVILTVHPLDSVR